jgi:hypothetical protein
MRARASDLAAAEESLPGEFTIGSSGPHTTICARWTRTDYENERAFSTQGAEQRAESSAGWSPMLTCVAFPIAGERRDAKNHNHEILAGARTMSWYLHHVGKLRPSRSDCCAQEQLRKPRQGTAQCMSMLRADDGRRALLSSFVLVRRATTRVRLGHDGDTCTYSALHPSPTLCANSLLYECATDTSIVVRVDASVAPPSSQSLFRKICAASVTIVIDHGCLGQYIVALAGDATMLLCVLKNPPGQHRRLARERTCGTHFHARASADDVRRPVARARISTIKSPFRPAFAHVRSATETRGETRTIRPVRVQVLRASLILLPLRHRASPGHSGRGGGTATPTRASRVTFLVYSGHGGKHYAPAPRPTAAARSSTHAR